MRSNGPLDSMVRRFFFANLLPISPHFLDIFIQFENSLIFLFLNKIASVQPVFRVVVVKLILMNVHHHHATMVEFVQIYRKAIAASVRQAIPVKIVKMKKAIVVPIHAQHVQCAKMNQAMEISHVFVEVDTQAMIVM